MNLIFGGDVSFWQDNNTTSQRPDFQKAYDNGWKFVYHKATQGDFVDSDFVVNWANSRKTSLKLGAYHFLVWNIDPKLQAEIFWNTIKNDPGELPLVVDFEWWSTIPSNAFDILYNFLERLKQLTNKPIMIYTAYSFWKQYGKTDAYWKQYYLWLAHYDNTAPVGDTQIPSPWTEWFMWQYTGNGDGPKYGMESAGVDLDYANSDLYNKVVGETNTGDNTKMTDYKLKATGLYTNNTNFSDYFDFIVGHAGAGYEEPAQNLKAIEEKATSFNRPFFVLWDFNVDYYRKNQFPMDEKRWPTLDVDWPYIYFTRALAARNYKAVMIRVMDPKNDGGNVEAPNFISFAANQFVARISGWLEKNKPGVPLIVVTSQDFINQYGGGDNGMNNWIYKFNSCVEQKAVTPLVDGAYPQQTDKVKSYVSVRNTCEFWFYFGDKNLGLMNYYIGPDKDSLKKFLGIADTPTDPGTDPTDPGTDPTPTDPELSKKVAELETKVADLTARFDALNTALKTWVK